MEGKEKKLSDQRLLWFLFKNCFVISACTFGGGMVIISMLQKKFVEELGWIKQKEVMDLVAIAQSCPGVMAVNASMIIGYRVAGAAGTLMAALGTILPPMLILTAVSACYVQFRENHVIALLLRGMQAGVAAVMMNVTMTLAGSVLKEKKTLPILMLAGASAATVLFGVDIILIILGCGCISAAMAVCGKKEAV